MQSAQDNITDAVQYGVLVSSYVRVFPRSEVHMSQCVAECVLVAVSGCVWACGEMRDVMRCGAVWKTDKHENAPNLHTPVTPPPPHPSHRPPAPPITASPHAAIPPHLPRPSQTYPKRQTSSASHGPTASLARCRRRTGPATWWQTSHCDSCR